MSTSGPINPTARSWPCARCDVGLVLLRELALVDRHLLVERGVVEELGGDRVDEVELPQLGDLVGDRFEPRVPRLGVRSGGGRLRRARARRRGHDRGGADDQEHDGRQAAQGDRSHLGSSAHRAPEVSGLSPFRPVGSRGAGGRIEVTGRLRCCVDEGPDPGRRRRHPASSDHPHERQAARADRQQADPLLRHRGHGRGRASRRSASSSATPPTRSGPRSATAPAGASRSPTSRRTRRSASRTACSSPATSSATTTS